MLEARENLSYESLLCPTACSPLTMVVDCHERPTFLAQEKIYYFFSYWDPFERNGWFPFF